MLDHVTIGVNAFERAKAFYDQALSALGIAPLDGDGKNFAGYGAAGNACFWIGFHGVPQTGVHVAFVAESREAVDRFYRIALASGGTDNGPPGLRVQYHPDYCAAFVLDPDGHNIEAVCRLPQAATPR